ATKVTNVGAQSDLTITKSGPASANQGQNITYVVAVKNNGPSPATSVVVSDPTPVGPAFISNAGACTTPYPCSLGTLNSGQSATITSTFNVPSNFTGTSVTNTANVSSSIADPNNTNNASAFTTNIVPPTGNTPSADLQMFKSGPGQAATGGTVSFGVQILNNG